MKKPVFTAVLASLAALMLIGCTSRHEASNGSKVTTTPEVTIQMQNANPTAEPTTEPTAEPSAEPTAESTVEQTEAPKSLDALPAEVESNQTINIDIDFDGVMDTVLLEEEELEHYESNYKLTVARGAVGAEPFEYEISYGKGARLIIIDCNENDHRLDILLSWDQCSDDPASLICRVNEDGSGIFTQEGRCYFSISGANMNPGEFELSVHANLLNADFLGAVATVDASGMKLVGDYKFVNDDEYWLNVQSLKHEMTVRIVNDDGSLGEEVTVPVGEHIVPVSTDLESYVKLRIPDGRIGQVEFSFNYEAPYIRLNDIGQDDYFTEKLNYAG